MPDKTTLFGTSEAGGNAATSSVAEDHDVRNPQSLDGKLKSLYKIKTKFLCPTPERGRLKEIQVLNRVISWSAKGISYEADLRHT